jgi:hypothetical protein
VPFPLAVLGLLCGIDYVTKAFADAVLLVMVRRSEGIYEATRELFCREICIFL